MSARRPGSGVKRWWRSIEIIKKHTPFKSTKQQYLKSS
jgi:hypothetical protein